jgi:hypothetical protein
MTFEEYKDMVMDLAPFPDNVRVNDFTVVTNGEKFVSTTLGILKAQWGNPTYDCYFRGLNQYCRKIKET